MWFFFCCFFKVKCTYSIYLIKRVVIHHWLGFMQNYSVIDSFVTKAKQVMDCLEYKNKKYLYSQTSPLFKISTLNVS